jgi:uncharacterized membrane protein
VALVTWLVLAALARVRGPAKPVPQWLLNEERDATAITRFEPTFHTVMFSVCALFVLMHVAFVGGALSWPASSLQVTTAIFGLGLIAVGNVMPRVKPNWIVGIRTPKTLADAAVWARAHRVLGGLIMATGALVIILSIAAPRYAIIGGFVLLLLSFPIAYLKATKTSQAAANPGIGEH